MKGPSLARSSYYKWHKAYKDEQDKAADKAEIKEIS